MNSVIEQLGNTTDRSIRSLWVELPVLIDPRTAISYATQQQSRHLTDTFRKTSENTDSAVLLVEHLRKVIRQEKPINTTVSY